MEQAREMETIKYTFATCDQPHVLASFFMEALRWNDWFQCRLRAKDAVTRELPSALNFRFVDVGKVMELEVTVEKKPFHAALVMIRSLMADQVKNDRYWGN